MTDISSSLYDKVDEMSELMFKWSKSKTTVVMETLDQNCYRLYATLNLSFRAHLDLGNYHALAKR